MGDSKSRQIPPGVFFAVIIAFLLIAGALLPGAPSPPPSPTTDIHVVAYPREPYLVFASGDVRPLSQCRFTVNSDYEFIVDRVEPNGRQMLPLMEFVTRAGKRFDPGVYVVKQILLRCDTADGRGYYGWERRR